MAAQFQFVIRSGPNAGTTYPLQTSEIIIGRDPGNTISINDGEVSRKHAKLSMQGDVYTIQDLGSTNGTFVNGQRLSGSQVLNPGDSVSIGENIVLLYQTAFDANATLISSTKPPRTVAPVSKSVQPQPVVREVPSAPAAASFPPVSPVVPQQPAKKKKFPVWLLILIIILLIICACIGTFVAIDQFNLWCQVVPFLVPLLGGTCG